MTWNEIVATMESAGLHNEAARIAAIITALRVFANAADDARFNTFSPKCWRAMNVLISTFKALE